MLRTLGWLTMSGLLLIACGPQDSAPGGDLGLRFAPQAIDGPCPEVASGDPAPPSLDKLSILLFKSDGSKHYSKTVSLAQEASAKVGGIPKGENLSLVVTGYEAGVPTWQGGAENISIFKGRSAYADVYMTRVDDMSCTARPMARARAHMAAAVNGQGQVVLAGGLDRLTSEACGPDCQELRATAVVDLFEPGSGSIHAGMRLNKARALATATTLADGSVLVVGGVSRARIESGSGLPFVISEEDLVDSYEIYLPQEDLWVEKPLPDGGRVFHSATLLSDGRVLIAGGGATLATARDDALLFDPAGESVGEMVVVNDKLDSPRLGHAAVALDDQVLIMGGAVLTTRSAVESFTWSGGSEVFSETIITGDSLNLFFHDAALLPLRPDEILLAGGSFYDGQNGLLVPSADNALIYSISQSQANLSGPMNSAHLMQKMIPLGNDRLLIAGGYTDMDLTPGDTVEYFDPAGSFEIPGIGSVETSLSISRGGQSVEAIEGGRALVVGGLGPDGLLGSGEIFTPAAGL